MEKKILLLLQPGPLDHESNALTTELSTLPYTAPAGALGAAEQLQDHSRHMPNQSIPTLDAVF